MTASPARDKKKEEKKNRKNEGVRARFGGNAMRGESRAFTSVSLAFLSLTETTFVLRFKIFSSFSREARDECAPCLGAVSADLNLLISR